MDAITLHVQKLYRELPYGEEAQGMSAPVSVAGRVMNRRVMGKLAFLTLRDDKGQIQVRGKTEKGPRGRDVILWDVYGTNGAKG